MPLRSTNNDGESHYKAIQTVKASMLGGRCRIPVCKSCYENHLRCPGPEIDDDGNYNYSQKCLRCLDYGVGTECDFESKMSALPRRSLRVMTEEELSTVMRTNKEMGKMHPREASMCNISHRPIDVDHFRSLPSLRTTSHLNRPDLQARELQPSTELFATQPVTMQPARNFLPDSRVVEYTNQPSRLNLSDGRVIEYTSQPSRLTLSDGRVFEYTNKPSKMSLPDGRVVEYIIVPTEYDDNITREHTYQAASDEIALAIQEQEDR